jgi:predicted CXXCH cytochrome family protein
LVAALALLTLPGCFDPEYLAAAKERYELRHHLKKDDGLTARTVVEPGSDQKKVHPPYAERACNQCHDGKRGSALLAQGDALCWLCHKPEEFRFARLHGPVAVGGCSDCHFSHESPYPNHTTKAVPALCLDCHSTVEWLAQGPARADLYVHSPVAAGKCPQCHDPHGGTRRYFLKAEAKELCLTCHEAARYGSGVVHGPAAVGDCLKCHTPHASRIPGLLKAGFSPDLCWRCHDRLRTRCPEKEKPDCLGCHPPHAAGSSKAPPGVVE